MEWEQLSARARAWIEADPDKETQAELQGLLAQGPAAAGELAERFQGPLQFGTAGLRGILGAGETRINRAVIRRTTHGLGAWLLSTAPERARQAGVAVGHDARRLSKELAQEVAEVLAAQGILVHLLEGPCPTPVLAFAVLDLAAAAGVMVTASHNPPQYNGYKVYAPNGAQIVSPADREIAALIAAAPPAREVPRVPLSQARARGLLREPGLALERRYLEGISQVLTGCPGAREQLSVVYTPLHGVGARVTLQAFRAHGFTQVATVAEQGDPDGSFPTVAFPNPEEEGALDLALALARSRGADLVVAQDPDADRLALCVRDGAGEWTQLNGNEVGALLGHFLLTTGWGREGDRLVIATIVSSPLLGHMARALGVRYEETLTGFKWIANRALEVERAQGTRFVFGYEEALGYTAGTLVRDKDGISAALLACELAARCKAEGRTLLDELEALARRYGLFLGVQRATVLPGRDGLTRMRAVMDGLRSAPPDEVGGLQVEAVLDYQARQRRPRGSPPQPLSLPASDVVALELAGGSRIVARPSGTEPKLKLYFDLREPLAAGEPFATGRERAVARAEALASAFRTHLGL